MVDMFKSVPNPSSAALPQSFTSTQAKADIKCGRPTTEHVGPPLLWYNQVFSKFVTAVADTTIVPTKEECSVVLELCNSMAKVFPNEAECLHAFDYITRDFLEAQFVTTRTGSGGSNDSIVTHNICFENSVLSYLQTAIFVREGKNEIGTGHSDPYLQATFSYLHYWLQDDYKMLRERSHCPSFLLCVAGPWLCIAGAIFLDRIIVTPLTDFVLLMPTSNINEYLRIFCILHAVRDAGRELRRYFDTLSRVPFSQPSLTQHLFPFYRKFDSNGREIEFNYINRLNGS